MLPSVVTELAIAWGIAKGAIVAAATAAIGLQFWQSVVVAAISGSLGAVGAIGAAYIASREAKRNRAVLHDIKRKVGAHQRARDEREEDNP